LLFSLFLSQITFNRNFFEKLCTNLFFKRYSWFNHFLFLFCSKEYQPMICYKYAQIFSKITLLCWMPSKFFFRKRKLTIDQQLLTVPQEHIVKLLLVPIDLWKMRFIIFSLFSFFCFTGSLASVRHFYFSSSVFFESNYHCFIFFNFSLFFLFLSLHFVFVCLMVLDVDPFSFIFSSLCRYIIVLSIRHHLIIYSFNFYPYYSFFFVFMFVFVLFISATT
jgi:hypothetical protein